MSLYNTIFGECPLGNVLLKLLDLPRDRIPRYRDCYLNEDGTRIVVYTRTGGGNRKAYVEGNAFLAKHPLYCGDHDDGFDSTYAYFSFRPPDWCVDDLKACASDGGGQKPAGDRFVDFIEKLKVSAVAPPEPVG